MVDLLPYVAAVLAVAGSIIVLLLRRPILLHIGVRNFLRRRGQVALAVGGLLIATSIISGSLVMGDSFDATIRDAVFRDFNLIDEVVWRPNATITYPDTTFVDQPKEFFDDSVFTAVRNHLVQMPHIAGLAPRIILSASILDVESGFVEPAGRLVAFDPALDFDAFLMAGQTYPGADLSPGDVLLNAKLAEQLGAGIGHSLRVLTARGEVRSKVHAIVDDAGKGGLGSNPNMFMRLSDAQTLLNLPLQVNAVLVSNRGGVREGLAATEDATRELATVVPTGFIIDPVKLNGIDLAESRTGWIKQVFSFVGIFTIIAGVLLIMNIFVVLAGERKSEMGMSRALGMRRTHLTETFLFEGLLYASAASAIGTFAGLGVAAFGILIFASLPSGGRTLPISYHFEASSLAIAFALGFLVTITVVVLASWRVARLNIVRAIRDLPEPLVRRGTRRQWTLGGFGVLLGLYGTWEAIVFQSPLLAMAGPSLLAYGAASIAQRAVGSRPAYTAGALAVIGWALYPPRFELYAAGTFAFDAFVVSGVLLVMSAIVAIMLNSRILLAGLTGLAGRRKSLRPVMKIAVSYPMARRARTGLTLAIFALVVFVITLASIFATLFFGNVDQFLRDQSGGYDIVAHANIPQFGANFDADLALVPVSSKIAYYSAFDGSVAGVLRKSREGSSYPVYGVKPQFADQNAFPFASLAPEYRTPRDAWEAIATNPNLAIFNGGFGAEPLVGEVFEATNLRGDRRNFTVIGGLQEFLIPGMFVGNDVARDFFFATAPMGFLFKVAPGASLREVNREIERDFVAYGMDATVFRDLVDEIMKFNLSFIQMVQAFLSLGLVVGLAGLGVVTMRNVVERRNEIGTLRAIGFRRGMVLKYLLIENSFVALLGIGIGMGLGIAYAYYMFQQFSALAGLPFSVRWTDLATIAGVAYSASLIATVPPARTAARLPPAEALRIAE